MNATLTDPARVQVPTRHYSAAGYDELHRWISYWYQIQAVVRSGARTVLEVGVGSGVLSSYLRTRLEMEVTTFDFDASLRPEIVGDVRQLAACCGDNCADAVVAFQVLEHLPFSDFEVALREMAKATRRSVIISLPYYGWDASLRMRFWKRQWAFGFRFSKNPSWVFNGEHHWEIATKGHSLATVRKAIGNVLEIERDYFCPDYPYHYFFECRRKGSG
jgi:ubiquinone/menaquinone biosynthesis C-methylase UbiE